MPVFLRAKDAVGENNPKRAIQRRKIDDQRIIVANNGLNQKRLDNFYLERPHGRPWRKLITPYDVLNLTGRNGLKLQRAAAVCLEKYKVYSYKSRKNTV